MLLVVHQGFAARFLLRTGILETLQGSGARIVILTPNSGERYINEEFAGPRGSVEQLRSEHGPRVGRTLFRRRPRLRVMPGTGELWWQVSHLRKYMLGDLDAAPAHREKRERFYDKERRRDRLDPRWLRQPLWLLRAGLWLSCRSRALRRLVLGAETRLFTGAPHADVFGRHRPDLVVTTSPGWFMPDAMVLREARSRGVKSVAMVLGWDNPTSKGYRAADPDRVIAWSEPMAEQLVRHQDIPRDRILVGGVPHWDHYRRPGALLEREALFEALGLDPKRRLVLLVASTPGIYAHNTLVAETLAEAIEDGRLGESAQLVVRLHPIQYRDKQSGELEDYDAVAERHPHVVLDKPEVLSRELRCDMPRSDALRFGSLVKHCDVLLNVFSTSTLEAFMVDRPVILIRSDAHLSAEQKAHTASRQYQTYAHQRRVMELGAARVAGSMQEIVDLTRAYLADPALDRDARAQVAREEVGPTDGFAGERIGRYLLESIGAAPGAQEGAGANGAPAGGARGRTLAGAAEGEA